MTPFLVWKLKFEIIFFRYLVSFTSYKSPPKIQTNTLNTNWFIIFCLLLLFCSLRLLCQIWTFTEMFLKLWTGNNFLADLDKLTVVIAPARDRCFQQDKKPKNILSTTCLTPNGRRRRLATTRQGTVTCESSIHLYLSTQWILVNVGLYMLTETDATQRPGRQK